MEFMRQIETNLLTFHSYAKGQYARMHTLETVEQELSNPHGDAEDRSYPRNPPAAIAPAAPPPH